MPPTHWASWPSESAGGPWLRAYAAGLKPSFYRSIAAALSEMLEADVDDDWDHAARALAALGMPGVPALAKALSSPREPVRRAADTALAAVQAAVPPMAESATAEFESAVPALNRALAGDRTARQAAARTLALLPLPAGPETIDRLRRRDHDRRPGDPALRRAGPVPARTREAKPPGGGPPGD